MSVVILNSDSLGNTTIRFRYDPELVAAIKGLVPSHWRTWDSSTKTWTVRQDCYVAPFLTRARQLGYLISDDRAAAREEQERARKAREEQERFRKAWSDAGRQHQQQRAAAAAGNWADQLLDAVGPERVEPVFRALTRVLHPDVATGSKELMQALNVARDKRKAVA